MKKGSFLLAMVLCAGSFLFGQRVTYFSEDFSALALGPNGKWDTAADPGYRHLYLFKSKDAGGAVPEASFSYNPSAGIGDKLNGTYRLVSKAKSTAGKASNYVSFKYFYNSSAVSAVNARSFGVVARVAGSSQWTLCREKNITEYALPAGVFSAQLPEEFSNKSEGVQIAVFYKTKDDGVLYYWMMDDISFFGFPTKTEYSALLAMTSPTYTSGDLKVKYNISNKANVFDSCVVSYALDGGEVKTIKTKLSDRLFPEEVSSEMEFTPEGWNATSYGKHALKMWLSEINGVAIAEADFEVLEKQVYNARTEELVAKKPVIEEFTSASCGPCASYNKDFLNRLFDDMDSSISLVKYQMNWPGTGDIYYTLEGGARRDFYGISSVPSLALNGSDLDLSTYGSYDKMKKKIEAVAKEKAFFEITFDTLGIDKDKNIHVACKIRTVGSLEGVTLQTAVIEKITVKNKGGNGETEFHHVMHKMLPGVGANGNTGQVLSMIADTTYKYSYVHNMGSTNMEEFNDLMVVCFLQDKNGEILQSETGSIGRFGEGGAAVIELAYVPKYACNEELPLGLKITSAGDEITSMELSGKVNASGAVVTKTYTLDLDWGESANVTFGGLGSFNDGVANTAIVNVSKINGVANVSQPIDIKFTAQKTDIAQKPLIEAITSSKSMASKEMNEDIDPIYSAQTDKVVLNKYPGEGDPYSKTDVASYIKMQKGNSVPSLLLNGSVVPLEKDGGLEGDYFEEMLDLCKNNNSPIAITIENATIDANGSHITAADIKLSSGISIQTVLYIFVVEKTTKNNASTNGESSFLRTVQSLMPSAGGLTAKINAGTPYEYPLKKTILKSSIENYDNVSLVVVLKDAVSGDIIQSAEVPLKKILANESADKYKTISVYPNPASEYTYIQALENASLEMFDINGQKVFAAENISGDYKLELSEYTPGQYLVRIKEGNKLSSAKIMIAR